MRPTIRMIPPPPPTLGLNTGGGGDGKGMIASYQCPPCAYPIYRTTSHHHNHCSRSSRKRPPRELEKVVITRAGRLQEYALVSDLMVKQ